MTQIFCCAKLPSQGETARDMEAPVARPVYRFGLFDLDPEGRKLLRKGEPFESKEVSWNLAKRTAWAKPLSSLNLLPKLPKPWIKTQWSTGLRLLSDRIAAKGGEPGANKQSKYSRLSPISGFTVPFFEGGEPGMPKPNRFMSLPGETLIGRPEPSASVQALGHSKVLGPNLTVGRRRQQRWGSRRSAACSFDMIVKRLSHGEDLS